MGRSSQYTHYMFVDEGVVLIVFQTFERHNIYFQ